jgi:hypothetical protein
MIANMKSYLRKQPAWLGFQEANREGWRRAWRRSRFQRRILDTPPTPTQQDGPVEVRVLTWRRDWLNLIWALKSFYHAAEVDYPLFIHDGGLLPDQAERLQSHFPNATLVPSAEADVRVAEQFRSLGLERCLAYRQRNPSTRKLFDFFAFSTADYIVSIDSDIVFFQRPDLLLVPHEGVERSRFNEDSAYWYSMELDELEAAFGLRPPPRINSGLSLIRRASIDFAAIDRWLEHPKLFNDPWVTEQTLHALCATAHGVELLPANTYRVDTEPGLSPEMVCKHYPGYFRHLLYSEGMAHLIANGFLDALRERGGRIH